MTDLNSAGLPPFQKLPDHVRDKARQELAEGLNRTTPPWRGPFAIAAAVVTLAAGAVVAGQLIWSPGTTPFATPATSTPVQFEGWDVKEQYQVTRNSAPAGMAERCAAAKPQNPPVAQWRPEVSSYSNGTALAAFGTNAGRIFCATTATTVSVSEPTKQGLDGYPARVLFATKNGAMAGLVQTGVRHLSVSREENVGGNTFVSSHQAAVVDQLFLVPSGSQRPDNETTFLIDGDEISSPERPVLTPTNTDRPLPPADRASEAGQRVKTCLVDQQYSIPDPDQFVPGAHAKLTGRSEVQLARFGDLLLECRIGERFATTSAQARELTRGEGWKRTTINGTWHYYDFEDAPQGGTSTNKRGVVGLVLDQRVASITATAPGMADQQAVISNGTYVVPGPVPTDATARLTVKDADGKVLEEINLQE